MTTGRIVRKSKDTTSTTTLPIGGIISIGEKVKAAGGKDRPTALNYFRVRGKNGKKCEYEQQFISALGDKPTKIPIAFISDDMNEVCKQTFVCYKDGKYWGEGDGETFKVYDPSNKSLNLSDRYKTVAANDPLVTVHGDAWKERLDMTFVIPSIKGVMCVWKFTTGGAKTTIPEIINAIDFVRGNAGTIRLFPFDLIVAESTGHVPGEIRKWSAVKLVGSFEESSVMGVKSWLGEGKRLEELGLFTFNKQIGSADVPRIEAPRVIAVQATADATTQQATAAQSTGGSKGLFEGEQL